MIFFKIYYLAVSSENEFYVFEKEPEYDEETDEWISDGDFGNLGDLESAKEEGLAEEFWNMKHEDNPVKIQVLLDINRMSKSKR